MKFLFSGLLFFVSCSNKPDASKIKPVFETILSESQDAFDAAKDSCWEYIRAEDLEKSNYWHGVMTGNYETRLIVLKQYDSLYR
jgi:hypothetical protein